jgi:hypothetical protein
MVRKTGFLIVSALRGSTTGPDDQNALRLYTVLRFLGTELNRNDAKEAQENQRFAESM